MSSAGAGRLRLNRNPKWPFWIGATAPAERSRRALNYGKGVLEWESDADADRFINGRNDGNTYQQVGSTDYTGSRIRTRARTRATALAPATAGTLAGLECSTPWTVAAAGLALRRARLAVDRGPCYPRWSHPAGRDPLGADRGGGSVTFSIPCVGNPTAVVEGETRSLAINNGSFTDAFADKNAIHIYRIDGSSTCAPS